VAPVKVEVVHKSSFGSKHGSKQHLCQNGMNGTRSLAPCISTRTAALCVQYSLKRTSPGPSVHRPGSADSTTRHSTYFNRQELAGCSHWTENHYLRRYSTSTKLPEATSLEQRADTADGEDLITGMEDVDESEMPDLGEDGILVDQVEMVISSSVSAMRTYRINRSAYEITTDSGASPPSQVHQEAQQAPLSTSNDRYPRSRARREVCARYATRNHSLPCLMGWFRFRKRRSSGQQNQFERLLDSSSYGNTGAGSTDEIKGAEPDGCKTYFAGPTGPSSSDWRSPWRTGIVE